MTTPAPSSLQLEGISELLDNFSRVTEELQQSHQRLEEEVGRLQKELAAKNRLLARKKRLALLGEMAAGVAHEIRNPLGSIRLNASLLMRDLRETPELLEIVNPLMQATEALDRIVDGLLDYTADREPDLQPCDLRTVIELSIAYARPELERHQVEITRNLDAAPGSIMADPELLRRVLLNLILNAAQAVSDSEGRIEIRVDVPNPKEVSISVIDNGEGMAEEQIEKIFHPFFTRRTGGTGLGLSICHRLIEAHRGHIEVISLLGDGSTFRVYLPHDPKHATPANKTCS